MTEGIDNVKRERLAVGLCAAAGAAAGALRALQLFYAFDGERLPVAGRQGLTVAVWVCCGLFLAAAAVLLRLFSGLAEPRGKFAALPGGAALAAAAAALAGAVRLAMSYRPVSVWGLILGAVTVLAAAALLRTVRAAARNAAFSERTRLISLVPVVALFLVILEFYRGVSVQPSAAWYAADAFGLLSLLLLFFSFAGRLNGRAGRGRILAFTGVFLLFGLSALIGRAAWLLAEAAGRGFGALVSAEGAEVLLLLSGLAAAAGVTFRRSAGAAENEPPAAPATEA